MTTDRKPVEFNPLASCWPILDDDAIQELADDIRANGLRHPIIVDDSDRILDGRNRHAACLIAGVEPTFEPFLGGVDEQAAFVLSMNTQRRHMTAAQRAKAAAKMIDAAKQMAAATPESLQVDSATKTNGRKLTAQQVADKLNVSRASVFNAKKLEQKGTDELKAAVDSGKVGLRDAAKLADKPAAEQRKAVSGEYSPSKGTATKPRPERKTETPKQPEPADTCEAAVAKALFLGSVARVLKVIVNSTSDDAAQKTATQLQQAADALLVSAGLATKGPPSVTMLCGRIPSHWPDDLKEAAADWVEHKQALPKPKRIQSLKAWAISCRRIEAYDTAEAVDLLEKATSGGFQGWEHPNSNGKPQSAARIRKRRRKTVTYDN